LLVLSISCGVRQMVCFLQLLFTQYTTMLSSAINIHNLNQHLNPDITQIYIYLSTPNVKCSMN